MSWYYALNGKQNGPVEQAELDRLVSNGTLAAGSLVWQAGMAEWKPYAEVFQSSATPAGMELCSHCGKGFTPDNLVRLDNRNVCAACKPIVLQKLREGVAGGDDERIRNEHLKHEASIKSVGTLYRIGGVLYLIAFVFTLIGVFAGPKNDSFAFGMGMAAFMAVFGAGTLYLGNGLQKFRRGSRIAAGILSGIGLLAIPFGTLINGYILYLLFSKKGNTIFTDDYQQVVARTPHIKYRTSVWVWVIVILVIVLMVIGITAALRSK